MLSEARQCAVVRSDSEGIAIASLWLNRVNISIKFIPFFTRYNPKRYFHSLTLGQYDKHNLVIAKKRILTLHITHENKKP